MPPYFDNNTSSSSSQWCGVPHKSQRQRRSRTTTNGSNPSTTTNNDLLRIASLELESMRHLQQQHDEHQKACANNNTNNTTTGPVSPTSPGSTTTNLRSGYIDPSRSFPPACLALLRSLPGNTHCIDCRSPDASWASVTYGATLCLACSGRHRGLGVQTSYVKSVTMDSWNHAQVLSMLEGGNDQLAQFFGRHRMGNGDANYDTMGSVIGRYGTKAALFYKHHLRGHVGEVSEGGVYMGREASRLKTKKKSSKRRSSTSTSTSSSSKSGGGVGGGGGSSRSKSSSSSSTSGSSSTCSSSSSSSRQHHMMMKKQVKHLLPNIPTIEENSSVNSGISVDSLCAVNIKA